MPAKRKELPLPCPKCGKTTGTVQFLKFNRWNSHVLCRIGHYDPKTYSKTRPFFSWCSFRTNHEFPKLHFSNAERMGVKTHFCKICKNTPVTECWKNHKGRIVRKYYKTSKSCGLEPAIWITIRHRRGWEVDNSRRY